MPETSANTSINRLHARLDQWARDQAERDRVAGLQYAEVKEALGGLRETVLASASLSAENKNAIASLDTKVRALEISDARSDAQRGVWVAISNSPTVKWLAAIVAAVGIFFTGKST